MIAGPEMLSWLQERRSVRRFSERAVEREVLARVMAAAVTAPSSTNRQPWRYAVVTDPGKRAELVAAAKKRTEEIQAVVARGHHAEAFGRYGDFFFEPIEGAAAIVVPQYREYTDQMAHFIRSGGGDPEAFSTPASMQMELCGASASVMLLLLQARAEGLGACWMAGPMVARAEIEAALEIRAPYRMLGAVALGYPAEQPQPTKRRPLDRAVRWFETAQQELASEKGEKDGSAGSEARHR